MPTPRSQTTRLLGAALAISTLLIGPSASAAPDGLPAGHGDVEDGDEPPPPASNPHGAPKGHGGGADGMFEPPEDGAMEDKSLPPGTLDVFIQDATGRPLPNVPVTVGVVQNSVAKGENRKRLTVTTNAAGVARLEHLERDSSFAYRPMVMTDGATFSAMPFRLPETSGMKALLHVYPVVEDISSAVIVSQTLLYAEVKDDRIQVQQMFKIYNFGKTAWVPKDLLVALPPEFTAFTTQQGMTDIGIDGVPKQGARVHGTFPPGQHTIEFRWQLPYAGESEVRFEVGLPPHVASARVIAPASKDMRLEVPGFPPPQSTNDGMGQRALITEKQVRREEPAMKSCTVEIKGLPTEGPGRFIATILSAGGLLVGLVLGAKKPGKRDRRGERERLLLEIEDLERAHLAGEIGPKTYTATRRELLDALARTFSDETAPRREPSA